jgi:hypothetical protein
MERPAVSSNLSIESDLRVLGGDDVEQLFDCVLLRDLLVVDAEGAHHATEAKCELIDVLLVAEGEQLPISAEPLHYSIDFLVRST